MGSVLQKFDADASAVEKELEKVLRGHDKLMRKIEQVGSKSEKAGKQSETAWDRNTASLVKAVGAYVSVQAMVDLAIKSQERMNRLMDEGASTTQSLTQARMRLAQVSATPEDFKANKELAARLSRLTGMTQQQSTGLIFDAESNGFKPEIESVARAGEVVGVETASLLAGKIRNLYNGKLTASETINMVLKAAQTSDADATQVADVLPGIAAAGNMINASPAEQMGAMSVLAARAGSAAMAGTEMEGFLRKVGLKGGEFGIQNNGLKGVFDQVSALPPDQFKKLMGDDASSNTFFQKYRDNITAIKQAEQDILRAQVTAGTNSSVLAQSFAARFADPAEMAARNARIAAQQNETTIESKLSMYGSRRDADASNLSTALVASGQQPLAQYAGSVAGNAARFVGSSNSEYVGASIADMLREIMSGWTGMRQGGSATAEVERLLQQQLAEQKRANALIEQQANRPRKQYPLLEAAIHDERD